MKIHELNFEGHYKARWARGKESFPQAEDPMSMIKEKTNIFIKGLIEKGILAEFRAQIKTSDYERTDTRIDYRNGFRYRNLQTNFATIKRIKIPRGRKSGYEYKLFKRYQRRHDEFDTAVLWATLGGMSQRRTKEMFKGIMGNDLSTTTVSRILKSLDQQLKEYREFPIALKYKYLLLDGFWIHILEGDVLTKRCIVCAMGITDTGEHDLLGFKLMVGESEESIKVFLNDFHRRGLTDIDLIIHDGSKGIENASK
ncbi:MAG: putative transposase [Lysobacterales bacterium]|jgi:putative transposase